MNAFRAIKKSFRCIYVPIVNFFVRIKNSPSKKHFGNLNPQKKFFVMTCDAADWGVYTTAFCFLRGIPWFEEKGFVPVWDMTKTRPQLLDDKKTKNVWEIYFKWNSECPRLDEIYKSKNVYIAKPNCTGRFDEKITMNEIINDVDLVKKYGGIFNKYMHCSEMIKERVDKVYKRVFPGDGRVLAFPIRECYRWVYDTNSYLGSHPKVLSVDDSIELIKEYMTKWDCDYVFVMTDDRECLETIKSDLRDKCINLERPLYHFYEHGKPVLEDKQILMEFKLQDNVEKNIEYMVEVELAARCNALFGSVSSGLIASILRNEGKYEHMQVYDLGKYEM